MLQEFTHLETVEDQRFRRWFRDDYFDLYLWYDEGKQLTGWQLCYGKPLAERAITWRPGVPMQHEAIDDGESNPGRLKESPVLQADGQMHREQIVAKLRDAIDGISDADVQAVLVSLRTA